ncbi:hypothetical protein BB560_007029 [Smittium megazygosporum]|uniref:Uncharacterized protein n=1 Tax=Smittium megazygosporum TaxID=133381 RepID=A0A2T9XZB1_9FUNG|nr:hypothetical protein BB560_007029 [Smittium megazygosporum]
MKITITALILFLSPVFSKSDLGPIIVKANLSGRGNQYSDINKVKQDAGVGSLGCLYGYLDIDCPIYDDATVTALSCYLKGKPGKSKGGIFMSNDLENTGASCPGSNVAPV